MLATHGPCAASRSEVPAHPQGVTDTHQRLALAACPQVQISRSMLSQGCCLARSLMVRAEFVTRSWLHRGAEFGRAPHALA